jgi:hypothetical protein
MKRMRFAKILSVCLVCVGLSSMLAYSQHRNSNNSVDMLPGTSAPPSIGKNSVRANRKASRNQKPGELQSPGSQWKQPKQAAALPEASATPSQPNH